MCKVTNLEEIHFWDLHKKHSEQIYVIEKYDNSDAGFYSIKINSMEQLKALTAHLLQEGLSDKFIFRGQRDSNWTLKSTLEREIKSLKTQEQYNEISQKHLDNFKKLARGKIKEQSLLLDNSDQSIEELWAIGQHFGLKTPLIDWTRSFLIALFFAFYKEENDTEYRSVYKLYGKIFAIDGKHKYIVEPKMDNYGRLTAQKGLFTYWGVDFHIKDLLKVFDDKAVISGKTPVQLENIKRRIITKYYISNELRKDILNYLEAFGISEDTMYPDLSGIINQANNNLTEIIKNCTSDN